MYWYVDYTVLPFLLCYALLCFVMLDYGVVVCCVQCLICAVADYET